MANGSGLAAEHFIPGTFDHVRSNVQYQVAERSGKLQLSYAASGEGEVRGTHNVLYFLGSGNIATTYLYRINGYLLESPIAYYTRLQVYAMAPGLENVTALPSALPVNARCLRCHMSGVQQPEPGSENHFSATPFLQSGITCERCHGDAGRHVASEGRESVINPVKLSPADRDSVCISCHLEGDASVERKGRSIFDYRPGDDIGELISYFASTGDATERSVSQTEQLNLSDCKRASGTRMSCMSCHDPHGDPAPADRVAFYRSKCLACHTQPRFATAHYASTPDCTSCHMPKRTADDTPHVAWTDHRILINPSHPTLNQNLQAGDLALILGSTPTPRELGLAYYSAGLKGHPEYLPKAERLLAAAYSTDPKDAAVLIALGVMARMQEKFESARTFYQQALAIDPSNMEAENDLATLLARAGDVQDARALWQSAFSLNQDSESIGLNLSLADCLVGEAADSQQVLQHVLLYSPASSTARVRLHRIQSEVNPCPVPGSSTPGAQ